MLPIHKTSMVTSPLTPESTVLSNKTSNSAENVSGAAGSKRKTESDETPSCSKRLFSSSPKPYTPSAPSKATGKFTPFINSTKYFSHVTNNFKLL